MGQAISKWHPPLDKKYLLLKTLSCKDSFTRQGSAPVRQVMLRYPNSPLPDDFEGGC
jgi:hypothetical protein